MATLKRNVLEDILIKNSKNKDSIFHEYKKKIEVGTEIFKELYSRYNQDATKEHDAGFCMDESGIVGLLSQCQSLQALLLLPAQYGLDFDDTRICARKFNKKGEPVDDANIPDNKCIREIMDEVIDDIFKRIDPNKSGDYRFDASPYDSRSFKTLKNRAYSNIEAITWVVPTFLLVLKYHATIHERCQWQTRLCKVISHCLEYLGKAFIQSPAVGTSDQLEIGWNFTHDCEEPSLYYTFAVCECYVDFFDTFKDFLEICEAERNKEIPLSDEMLASIKQHDEDRRKGLEKNMPNYQDGKPAPARFDDAYNELVDRYKEINGSLSIDATTLYGKLESLCKQVANEVWRLTKDGLADQFYYNNLRETIDEKSLAMSTTSDVLFNTVYIINIMIDAGLDEDFRLEQELAEHRKNASADEKLQVQFEEEAARAEKKYNDLFESCQLANQKAIRAYEKLKSMGKEYIVDQFLIGFNERFEKHHEWIKELRKLRMRVFSLMPLLIRTNNVISEYLIKYPQVTMSKYLGYILENRLIEGKKYKWIWESDGFFSASNYYYISALGEFYSYYENYEDKYIPIEDNNESVREKIYTEEYEKKGVKEQLKKNEERITELEKEKASIKTPVEDAVSVIVRQTVADVLPLLLTETLESVAQSLVTKAVNDVECPEIHARLVAAVKDLAVAMLSENLFKRAAQLPTNRLHATPEAKFENLSGRVTQEFSRCVGEFIKEVRDNNKVNLFTNIKTDGDKN